MLPTALTHPLLQQLSTSHQRVLVAAHRGAWHAAPENSLEAIEAAISLGADIVECDVQSTRDGVLVLLHDATLERMTSMTGSVAETDWCDLRQAFLRSRDGGVTAQVTGQRPATLVDALCLARGRIIVNIDLKSSDLADRVALATIASGMADQVFLKAFINQPSDLDALRSSPFFGKLPFVPMLKSEPGALRTSIEALSPWQFPMYEVEFGDLADLNEAQLELQRQRARLWVNTIEVSHSLDYTDGRALLDPDAVWGRLLSAGVGAIQTDAVGSLVSYLQRRGLR